MVYLRHDVLIMSVELIAILVTAGIEELELRRRGDEGPIQTTKASDR
jgi:hypothetical protein